MACKVVENMRCSDDNGHFLDQKQTRHCAERSRGSCGSRVTGTMIIDTL